MSSLAFLTILVLNLPTLTAFLNLRYSSLRVGPSLNIPPLYFSVLYNVFTLFALLQILCILFQSSLLYLRQVPLVSFHVMLFTFFSCPLYQTPIFPVISRELHAAHDVLHVRLSFIWFKYVGTHYSLSYLCQLSIC